MDRPDRIAALSQLYPDLTVGQLEALDTRAQLIVDIERHKARVADTAAYQARKATERYT